jgi:hypothetical protein
LPDFIVGPIQDVFIRTALQVKPTDARRTHAEQRKTAFVICVDELFRRRRRLHEYAQPSERIEAFESGEHALGHRRSADAMITIAAGDEIAYQLPRLAILEKANRGPGRRRRVSEIVDAGVCDFKMYLAASGQPCVC